MKKHFLWLIAATSLVVAPQAAQSAGNLWSFSRASQSVVDYRATLFSAASDCSSLSRVLDSSTKIKSMRIIAAENGTPEHCRIDGVIPQTIGFQINLPTRWNGRIYMYGNGGYAGEDAEAPAEQRSRAQALTHGFAAVRTDTGHLAATEPLGTFAKDPGKLVDHGYRAVHETIEAAKKLVRAFYDREQSYSYWDGCSTGGREGVMAAQRYPADFDGIVAVAPTLRWSAIMAKGLSNEAALQSSGLTAAKMQTVFSAVLNRCDAADGLKDGLVSEPAQCMFDPARDLPLCTGADTSQCFSNSEIDGLKQIYAGPRDPAGKPVFVGQYPGSEDATTVSPFILNASGGENLLFVFGKSWMKDLAFKDPSYDWKSFEPARDLPKMAALDEIFNPKPDLEAFRARGGKMITWWGLADNALNPQMGHAFYETQIAKDGLERTKSYYRFFNVPGVAHCRGGYGPSEIDALSAVIDWVEKGKAPERLPAKLNVSGTTKYNRSYCTYPQKTTYVGNGDPEDIANFDCRN